MSGKPVYEFKPVTARASIAGANKQQIKKHLDTPYVNSKITIMHDVIEKDSELAIGTAKELLETTCKSILKQKGLLFLKDWSLPVLAKRLMDCLTLSRRTQQVLKRLSEQY